MEKLIKCVYLYKIVILALLISASSAFSQSRTNPFEIKPRLKDVPISDTSKFVAPSIKSDSINKQSLPTDTLTLQNDSLNGRNNVGTLKSKNPFEVDHVPIRKATIVDKKTEDIKVISESTKGSTRFLFFFLILGCALLAIVIGTGRRTLSMISKSLINENILKLFFREDMFKPSTFLLYIIFFINISAFIYLCSVHFGGPSGILNYGLILAGVIGIYLIRHTSLFLLGIVFPVSKATGLYSFTVMVFNHFIGLVLIPMNLFLALGPTEYRYYLMVFGVFILAILYILRIFRGFFIVSEYFIERFFQIIIYLCAFEIVPVLILLKTISNFME